MKLLTLSTNTGESEFTSEYIKYTHLKVQNLLLTPQACDVFNAPESEIVKEKTLRECIDNETLVIYGLTAETMYPDIINKTKNKMFLIEHIQKSDVNLIPDEYVGILDASGTYNTFNSLKFNNLKLLLENKYVSINKPVQGSVLLATQMAQDNDSYLEKGMEVLKHFIALYGINYKIIDVLVHPVATDEQGIRLSNRIKKMGYKSKSFRNRNIIEVCSNYEIVVSLHSSVTTILYELGYPVFHSIGRFGTPKQFEHIRIMKKERSILPESQDEVNKIDNFIISRVQSIL